MLRLALIVLFSSTTACMAETDLISVDEVKRADMVFIQRGWQADVGKCALGQIDDLRNYYGVGEMWRVVLDDSMPIIKFERKDGSHVKVCSIKGLREIGTGVGGGQVYDNFAPHGGNP